MDHRGIWRRLYEAEIERNWSAVESMLTHDFVYVCDEIHTEGPKAFTEYFKEELKKFRDLSVKPISFSDGEDLRVTYDVQYKREKETVRTQTECTYSFSGNKVSKLIEKWSGD